MEGKNVTKEESMCGAGSLAILIIILLVFSAAVAYILIKSFREKFQAYNEATSGTTATTISEPTAETMPAGDIALSTETTSGSTAGSIAIITGTGSVAVQTRAASDPTAGFVAVQTEATSEPTAEEATSASSHTEKTWKKVLKVLLNLLDKTNSKWLAGLLYLIGDNLDSVLKHYGARTSSTIQASFALLVLAVLVYMLPFRSATGEKFRELRNERDEDNREDEREVERTYRYGDLPDSYKFCEQLLPIFAYIKHLPKGDTFFTALSFAPDVSTATCGNLYQPYAVGTWVYLGGIPIVIFLVILYDVIKHWVKHDWFSFGGECCEEACLNQCCFTQGCGVRCVVAFFQIKAAFCVGVIIFFYILADNGYPLQCMTDNHGEATARLAFWAIVIVAFISTVLFIYCYHLKKRNILSTQGGHAHIYSEKARQGIERPIAGPMAGHMAGITTGARGRSTTRPIAGSTARAIRLTAMSGPQQALQ